MTNAPGCNRTATQVDVLVEMAAAKCLEEDGEGGRRYQGRYAGLALFEGLKSVMRLALLRQGGARLLQRGGEEGAVRPPPGKALEQDLLNFRVRYCLPPADGLAHPRVTSGDPEAGAHLQSAQRSVEAARALTKTAEIVHALRPAVYAVFLYRHGRASWRPFVASLSLDLASLAIHARARAILEGGGTVASRRYLDKPYTERERDELSRRKLVLAMYLLRSPLFELGARPTLETVAGALTRLPLVGSLAPRGSELLIGMQQYFSYTNAQ